MDLILVRLEVCLKIKKGLILQERDVELLEFLAEYKAITFDNTKYIYGTKHNNIFYNYKHFWIFYNVVR